MPSDVKLKSSRSFESQESVSPPVQSTSKPVPIAKIGSLVSDYFRSIAERYCWPSNQIAILSDDYQIVIECSGSDFFLSQSTCPFLVYSIAKILQSQSDSVEKLRPQYHALTFDLTSKLMNESESIRVIKLNSQFETLIDSLIDRSQEEERFFKNFANDLNEKADLTIEHVPLMLNRGENDAWRLHEERLSFAPLEQLEQLIIENREAKLKPQDEDLKIELEDGEVEDSIHKLLYGTPENSTEILSSSPSFSPPPSPELPPDTVKGSFSLQSQKDLYQRNLSRLSDRLMSPDITSESFDQKCQSSAKELKKIFFDLSEQMILSGNLFPLKVILVKLDKSKKLTQILPEISMKLDQAEEIQNSFK